MLGGTIEEIFFHVISRCSAYLNKEFELEYELRTDYNSLTVNTINQFYFIFYI